MTICAIKNVDYIDYLKFHDILNFCRKLRVVKAYQKKLKHDYNRLWDRFLDNTDICASIRSHQVNRKTYYEMIDKYISRINSPMVLELGCGTSIDINTVYERNRNIQPYASDILIKSIQIGSKISQLFNNEIKFFVSNTRNLPFKDCQFHIIFSQGLIEHFRDPINVIREQARILKKGGFLIINVPQKFTAYSLKKKIEMRRNIWELGWETEFSYNQLKKLGKERSLKEVDIRGYQYWKSRIEPIFVLKDLIDKIDRNVPILRFNMFGIIQKKYNSFWQKMEQKLGHYFMQNIIIVFRSKLVFTKRAYNYDI